MTAVLLTLNALFAGANLYFFQSLKLGLEHPINIFLSSSTFTCQCEEWIVFSRTEILECCAYSPIDTKDSKFTIMAINTLEFMLYYPAHYPTFLCFYHNPIAAIYVGDSYLKDHNLECKYNVELLNPVSFEGHTVVHMLHSGNKDITYVDDGASERYICTGIAAAIAQFSYKMKSFAIISDRVKDPSSVAYWFSQCSSYSDLVVVNQQDSIPVEGGEENLCKVEMVFGLEGVMTSKSQTILCIEDVLLAMATPSSSLGRLEIEGEEMSPLVFMSTIGMEKTICRSDGKLGNDIAHIFAVLRAHRNVGSPRSHLRVSSFASGLAELLRQCGDGNSIVPVTSSDCRLQDDDAIVRVTKQLRSSTDEAEWSEAFGILVWNTPTWFGDGSPLIGISDSARQLWNRHLLQEGMIGIWEVLCDISSTCSADYKQEINPFAHILTAPSARELLSDYLMAFSSFALRNIRANSGLSSTLMEIGKSIKTCSKSIEEQDKENVFDQKAFTIDRERFGISTTTAHVLIYVPFGQIKTGEEWLQRWKIGCNLCSMVSNYVLTPWDESNMLTEGDTCDEEVNGKLLRFILLHSEDYITHAATRKDVVAILIGIEALAAFIEPGGLGLIPHTEIGSTETFRLDAPLLFARKPSSIGNGVISNSTVADIRAFAGTAPEILLLQHSVLRTPLSSLSGPNEVLRSFMTYIDHHWARFALDNNREFFDFSRLNSLSPLDLIAYYREKDGTSSIRAEIISTEFKTATE